MSKKDDEAKRKKLLLEAAVKAATVQTNDPVTAKSVAEFNTWKKLRLDAEKAEKLIREDVETALTTLNAAVLVTPSGTVTLTVCTKEVLDESLIPADILKAARKTVSYVKLDVAGAING